MDAETPPVAGSTQGDAVDGTHYVVVKHEGKEFCEISADKSLRRISNLLSQLKDNWSGSEFIFLVYGLDKFMREVSGLMLGIIGRSPLPR